MYLSCLLEDFLVLGTVPDNSNDHFGVDKIVFGASQRGFATISDIANCGMGQFYPVSNLSVLLSRVEVIVLSLQTSQDGIG